MPAAFSFSLSGKRQARMPAPLNTQLMAGVPQSASVATKDGQDFLTWMNRMYRINPMPRMAGSLAWAGIILSFLFIHVKNSS
jgi:hypothetical protein